MVEGEGEIINELIYEKILFFPWKHLNLYTIYIYDRFEHGFLFFLMVVSETEMWSRTHSHVYRGSSVLKTAFAGSSRGFSSRCSFSVLLG